MTSKLRTLAIACALLGIGCRLSAPPATPLPATTTPAPSVTPTLTHTPSPFPSPTATPSPTPVPSATPTPAPTSVFVRAPSVVDLDGDAHQGRPRLSGTVRKVDTAHFRIFYTLSGRDAVSLEDRNGDAVPDYIEAVGQALEFAWQMEIEQLGWSPPPPDNHLGGDQRYDIYIQDLEFAFAGIAEGGIPEAFIGDNPYTPVIEQQATFSFVRLDNDFLEIEPLDLGIAPLDFMRVTVAHELLHAVQFGYDGFEPHRWLWEASATWIETVVYDEIRNSPLHLIPAFKSPDTCLLSPGGLERWEDQLHWYSRWLFLDFLAGRYGDEIVRQIWEQAVELDGYSTLEGALGARETSLEAELRAYALALLLRDFPFPLDYPTVRLEAALNSPDFYRTDRGVGQLGADFFTILAPGPVAVHVRQLSEGMLVGIGAGQADTYPLVDGRASIDGSAYEAVYLIVMNLERAESIAGCSLAPYSVETSSEAGVQEPAERLPAGSFRPPSVETLEPFEP